MTGSPTSDAGVIDDAKSKAALSFAMETLNRMPKTDRETLEAHVTAILIVFWGLLWGTFGQEYAQGFIESQLRSMQGESERFVPPVMQ